MYGVPADDVQLEFLYAGYDNFCNFTRTYKDLKYTTDIDDTIIIQGYKGDSERVIIPADIDGKSVKSIGQGAFNYFSTGITSITIPETVTSIDDHAFYSFMELTIYGKKGSYVETFAKNNGYTFVAQDTIVEVTGIKLNKTSTTITKGNSETLTAKVIPDNAKDKTVTWTTNDSRIATVSG